MSKPLVVNLFGGPGAGKSTTAAGVFTLLKMHGVNTELITEFAKDLTWEKREKTLNNQLYVFGKQYHRMWRVMDQVDVIVTDSPLLLSLCYGDDSVDETHVCRIFDKFRNRNFFIERDENYRRIGRPQTKEEAINIDKHIMRVLKKCKIDYETISKGYTGTNLIVQSILREFSVVPRYFLEEFIRFAVDK